MSGYYGNVCYSSGCYGNLLGTSSNHSVQMRKSPEALFMGNLEMTIFASLILKRLKEAMGKTRLCCK